MFLNLGLTMLLVSSWLVAWRFYVWAKREERRADFAEARIYARTVNPWHVHAEIGGDDAE